MHFRYRGGNLTMFLKQKLQKSILLFQIINAVFLRKSLNSHYNTVVTGQITVIACVLKGSKPAIHRLVMLPTCIWDFCHLGFPGRCCLWTQSSFETCSPPGKCRLLQPTVGRMHRQLLEFIRSLHICHIKWMHASHYQHYQCWTCLLPGVHPKETLSSQHHGSDLPTGTSLESEVNTDI